MTNNIKNRRYWLVFAIISLPISFVLAISFGTISISLSEVLSVYFDIFFVDKGSLSAEGSRAWLIIEQIRLPRALLATFVGALLGICGAASQGLFRNPLADPSLIGVTAGASAGAAITIFFASSVTSLQGIAGIGVISFGSFIGGALAVLLVYKLATKRDGTSVARDRIPSCAGSLPEYREHELCLRRYGIRTRRSFHESSRP